MTEAKKNRYEKAKALWQAPPTVTRRLLAAAGAALIAAGLVTLFFVLVFNSANSLVFWLSLVGAAIAAASAAATSRVGVSVIYGLVAVAWLVMEIAAAALAAIASAFS